MLSLADAGALHYDFDDQTDVATIIHRCYETISPRFRAAGIHATLNCEGQLKVYGDALRLTQVFTNILENSLRYTDTPGQLQLHCHHDTHHVYITIDDSAPGVTADDQERIFERLYRVDRSRNRAQGGAGLGLALCQRIIHAHHGRISAASSPLGGLQLRIVLLDISKNEPYHSYR